MRPLRLTLPLFLGVMAMSLLAVGATPDRGKLENDQCLWAAEEQALARWFRVEPWPNCTLTGTSAEPQGAGLLSLVLDTRHSQGNWAAQQLNDQNDNIGAWGGMSTVLTATPTVLTAECFAPRHALHEAEALGITSTYRPRVAGRAVAAPSTILVLSLADLAGDLRHSRGHAIVRALNDMSATRIENPPVSQAVATPFVALAPWSGTDFVCACPEWPAARPAGLCRWADRMAVLVDRGRATVNAWRAKWSLAVSKAAGWMAAGQANWGGWGAFSGDSGEAESADWRDDNPASHHLGL